MFRKWNTPSKSRLFALNLELHQVPQLQRQDGLQSLGKKKKPWVNGVGVKFYTVPSSHDGFPINDAYFRMLAKSLKAKSYD